MPRLFPALSLLLLLAGCALPYEARTAYSRSTDDDGRHARNIVTTELRWPLWERPVPASNYVDLPRDRRPAPSGIFAEPPCSEK